MTANEFMTRLETMNPQEKEDFKRRAGCTGYSDEMCLTHFVTSTECQSRYCYALGERSQADRVARATFGAAWYAKAAFIASLAIGIPALVVAVIALVK